MFELHPLVLSYQEQPLVDTYYDRPVGSTSATDFLWAVNPSRVKAMQIWLDLRLKGVRHVLIFDQPRSNQPTLLLFCRSGEE